MTVRETTISFPVARGSGPMTADRTLVFPRQVRRAVAAVRGYQVGFAGSDHHVGLLEVALDTAVDQNTVTVHGRLGVRDWSGSWDDDYGGTIQVSVIAELASAAEPPPRGDVVVVDAEINQAVQFFRSAEHLDAANVRPDNSIPLIAGKATGLRAFVDYDPTSGLPLITNLSGELVVSSGGASTTLAPIATIQPRPATEINRGQVDHTLNFLIPGGWCNGAVEVTLRVFDATAPAQKSGALRRTLRFVRVNPLRVYAVGVNYTGAGLNLPAPVTADFASTFDYTRRVWPTGDVLLSGYTTLAFSDSLAGTASEGCGDGFNDLQDELKDIKGDTDDLVYGLLPTGTPLTGVAGCGGGGAGSGMIGDGVTAAHEAGHAVGRQHAPCDDSARCDSPRNTDDDFPRYGSYVSDSIGEFGFDAENNRVRDPATATDFMGYSGNDWISPYTYAALMARGDPQPSTGASARLLALRSEAPDRDGPFQRAEWIKRREDVLFLRVRVEGDDVTVLPSFTYPAYRRPVGPRTGYEVHVVDADGRTRACEPLRRASGGCGCCGRATLFAEVPITGEPDRLVVRHRGKAVAEVQFEESVELRCGAEETPEGDLRLTWDVDTSGDEGPQGDRSKEDPSEDRIWFLVQWRDRDGTWRGLAPRTTKTSCVVPSKMQWAAKDGLHVRILATRRLTTSSCAVDLESRREDPPLDVTVYTTPGAVSALAVDPLGRKVPSEEIIWFDEGGGELGHGDRLPRSALERGVIRAVPLGGGITGAEGLAVVGETSVTPGSSGGASHDRHRHQDDEPGHADDPHRGDDEPGRGDEGPQGPPENRKKSRRKGGTDAD